MKRVAVVLGVLAAVSACGGSGSSSGSSSAGQAAASPTQACADIITHSQDVISAVSDAKGDVSKTSAAFTSYASQLRNDVSRLPTTNQVRIDGEKLATEYQSAATRMGASGFNPTTVGEALPAAGYKIVADCKK